MDSDLELALKLHREWNSDMSPVSNKKIKKPRTEKATSIVNPEWEITDPNPDIHSLFQVFDKKYFWGRLDCVEVKWSSRMYSCAGICTYKGKWGGCIISLSLPLLKLRPRKDLVETLLHEMIHAFLFVADKNRDRGEHGPKFHEHMHRINKEAGTNITVYHTFHDEVKHYKQHWWRCNGPCQQWKPFFGLVKRSMNRAPGPNDFWFADHQAKCGGEFIKIKEPENFKSRKPRDEKRNEKTKNKSKESKGPSSLLNFFEVPKKGISTSKMNSPVNKAGDSVKNTSNEIKSIKNNNTSAKIENYTKIGNVHGFTNLSKPGQNSPLNSSTAPKGPFGNGATGIKSNKGGTLLLNPKPSTSQTNNKEEKKEESTSPKSNFVAFSGSGHKLSSSSSAPTLAESRAKFLERLMAKSNPHPKPVSASPSNKGRKDSKPSPLDSKPSPSKNGRSDSKPSPSKKARKDSKPSPSKNGRSDSEPFPLDSKPSPSKKGNMDSKASPSKNGRSDSKPFPLDSKPSPSKKGNMDSKASSSKNGRSDSKPAPSSNKRKASNSDTQNCEQPLFKKEYDSINTISDSEDEFATPHRNESIVHCPVCNKEMPEHSMNEHLDSCVTLDSVFENSRSVDLTEDLEPEEESPTDPTLVNCPSCGFSCRQEEINDHLDMCLN